MNILRKARKLESDIARTLDRAAQRWAKSGPREPLEILHGIVDTIEERVEPAGRDARFRSQNQGVGRRRSESRAPVSWRSGHDPKLHERIGHSCGCDGSTGLQLTALLRAARDALAAAGVLHRSTAPQSSQLRTGEPATAPSRRSRSSMDLRKKPPILTLSLVNLEETLGSR